MSIRILKAGILDSIQDEGRPGFAKWGVNRNGAMDRVALALANSLAGNDKVYATIEFHFPAPEIYFEESAIISLTGADSQAEVDGKKIPTWKTVFLPKGSKLKFTHQRWGVRGYLAVHGGFDIQPWLNSYATNLKSHLGGFEGRKLMSGDRLLFSKPMGLASNSICIHSWAINFKSLYSDSETIAFIPGPEWPTIFEESQRELLAKPVSISPSSDRMAVHLKHPAIQFNHKEILSSAVTFGTMQSLPSGKIIVLMADHQTTGGYPRIGHIASSDLHKLSQSKPGTKFYLKTCSTDDAEKLLFSTLKESRRWSSASLQYVKSHYDLH